MILAPTLLLNAGSGAAIARPTFSRDFAGEKTLDNGTGPAITFTRASNATFFDASGTLQTASNDAPRFDHDPATGASRGLLIEEARTNSFERSAEFDNAYWTKTGVTISANAATAPDGTVSADEVVENNANSSHTVSRGFTSVSGTTYTLSIFVKQSVGTRNIRVAFGTGGFASSSRAAFFNPSNGTIVSADAGVTATVQTVGSFYRFSTTATATGNSAGATGAFALADGTTLIYQGDEASSIFYWGAQLEVGAFPTSYIPTTAAAATRATDVADITSISSFYNQAEGTLFAEGVIRKNTDGTPLLFDDTTQDEVVRLSILSNGIPSLVVVDGGASQASIGIGSAITAPFTYKMAGAIKENDFQAALNGTLGTADTSGTMPTLTRLRLGRRLATTGVYNGHIRKVAYWPRRLSNTLLEQLTT